MTRALCLLGLAMVLGRGECGPELHPYWPRFPRPAEVIQVPFVGDHEEGITFETAVGLAAAALAEGRGRTMVHEVTGNSGYVRWDAAMMARVKPRLRGPMGTWEAVAELVRQGVVKGYILFRYDRNARPFHALGQIDESANVATSLAGLLGAVAVSEGQEAHATALGLTKLADVRDKTEAWCLENYGEQFSRDLLMTCDPKSRVARAMAVAARAFVVSQPGPVYEAALARCRPDCPVLGWGCGAEDANTMPSSQWGLFQTATNWCHNLTSYSTEDPARVRGLALPERCRRELGDLAWESGVHYATFVMSDGDNVQWLMGNFAGGTEGPQYYESPARGRFDFGWTFPYVDLAQVCPYTLQDLFRRATARDDFVLYGGGYLYPDHYGEKRDVDCLALHARRIGAYMRLGGLHTLAYNLMDWDSAAAQRAYGTLAREIPELEALYTVQYYPYSGGEGRILWTPGARGEMPVISARLCIWAQTGRPRDTTPAGVAKWLNGMPRSAGAWTEDHFSYVMAHAWSRFRDTGDNPSVTAEEAGVAQDVEAPGTSRGLLPVQWCVRRLEPGVRVVTPAEMALLVRLHLRTRETLRGYAEELRARAGKDAVARRMVGAARGILAGVRDGDDSGKACFEALQRVERLIEARASGECR